MSETTVDQIQKALQQVRYPGFSRDIVSFGLVRRVDLENETARLQLAVTTADPEVPARLKADVEQAVGQVEGVRAVEVEIAVTKPRVPPAPGDAQSNGSNRIADVRFAIAVASGKGGVGKSTFAVNLACAFESILRRRGKPEAVGIMDCDIYGPSVPLMMGIAGRPMVDDQNSILPLENFGIRVMSMGFLVDEDTPVVWRGPMIMKTIQQFAQNVRWGKLEILVIDLPPGTGDAQLSLVQTIPLDGAVVVTTPQAAAVNVARRGAMMFGKVNVPLLGVAENMSYLLDPSTGEKNAVFGQGGGEQAARDLATVFLGQIPLDGEIRAGGDSGVPVMVGDPDGPSAKAFMEMAKVIWNSLEEAAGKAG